MSEIQVSDLGIIIAAGGNGSRFASEKSKLFADCGKMPVFLHSIKNLINLCPPENFILVVRKKDYTNFTNLLTEYLPDRNVKMITGGETRMHSVFNGLQALSESAKFVAVHDAARPFASSNLLLNCLKQARKYDGAVVAKKVTDTVKKACSGNLIIETVDRDELWTVETPQIFPRENLICAYRKAFADGIATTDDAGVMEHAKFKPFLFEHKGDNRKITYPEDMIFDIL